jgi:hypothetical protein
MAFVGGPHLWTQASEVHISVSFSWDMSEAERLEKEWRQVAPVKIGGPAIGTKGENFEPGMYLKKGNIITSRGCPNKCWFCKVWRRDGPIRELPIRDGWRLHDDNLLACSERHIRAVFAMLERQPHKAEFASGVEAKILQPWHVELFAGLKPSQIFCAYDTPDDLEPLQRAGKMFVEAGLKNALRAFVLIGWPRDTIEAAETRMHETWDAGFMPFAMLWRDENNSPQSLEWRRFQRLYCRPAATRAILTSSNKLTEKRCNVTPGMALA